MEKGLPEPNDSTLFNMKAKYLQNGDTETKTGDINQITISNIDVGDGHYFVMKTKRWAFDDIKEVIDLLEDFKKRFEL